MGGWKKEDLQQASFRQIEFDFVDIEDGFKKAIAKFEYPYADGADLEDMGLEARTIRMKAVLMGENYYMKLVAFMAALKEQGPGQVIHPVFGSFQAVPNTVSIRHDERAYFAELDITFLEHKELKFSVPILMASAKMAEGMEQAAKTGAAAEAALAESLRGAGIPSNVPPGIGEKNFMSKVAGYSSAVRKALAGVNSVVATAKSYLNLAGSPFRLITSSVNFATGLPGSVLSSFADTIESVAGAYLSLLNAPGKFTNSFHYGLLKVDSAFQEFKGDKTLKASWLTVKASALAMSASVDLAADEKAEQGESMSLKAFGSDVEIERAQVMTMDEIDAAAGLARSAINEAIQAVREAYGNSGYDLDLSLKATALGLQETADRVRLNRERIVEYEVQADTSLHLLAFKLYGDISHAERLLRINRIINPNFISGGQVLRVYA